MLNITDQGKQFKPMIGMTQGSWWIPGKIKYRFLKVLERCWFFARAQENEKRWSTAKQITTNRCNHEGWRSVFARLHHACLCACMRAPLLSLHIFYLSLRQHNVFPKSQPELHFDKATRWHVCCKIQRPSDVLVLNNPHWHLHCLRPSKLTGPTSLVVGGLGRI